MKKYIALSVLLLIATVSYSQRTSKKSAVKQKGKAKTEVRSQKRSSSSKASSASKSRSSSAKARTNASKSRSAVIRSSGTNRSSSSKARSSNAIRSISKAIKSRSASDSKSSAARTSQRADSKSNSRSISDRKNKRSTSVSKTPVRANNRNTTVSRSGNNRINTEDRKAIRSAESAGKSTDVLRKTSRKSTGYASSSGILRSPRVASHNNGYWRYRNPLSLEIRRHRFPYRRPRIVNVYWTRTMYVDYVAYYPFHTSWQYDIGHPIDAVSAYEASYYEGQVMRVYGKVEEVFYSPEDRNYYLYFGNPFPYHDFSVVISRKDAKRISLIPEWYFDNKHIIVTGLITWFDDKPEIIVKNPSQIRRY